MESAIETGLLQAILRIKRQLLGNDERLEEEDAADYERGLRLRLQLAKAPGLQEGIRRYLEAKSSELSKRSRAEYGTYLRKILRLAETLAETSLAEISPEQWGEILKAVYPTAAGRNKARRLLHGLYAYAAEQGWTPYNPIDRLSPEYAAERPVRILQPAQINILLQNLRKPAYVGIAPAIGFMLWEGKRVSQLKEMNWENIVTENLSQALKNWLSLFPAHYRGGIIPGNWITAWRRLRRETGMHDWQNDTLFHTFVVYHLSYFKKPDLLTEKIKSLSRENMEKRYGSITKINYTDAASYWNPVFEPNITSGK